VVSEVGLDSFVEVYYIVHRWTGTKVTDNHGGRGTSDSYYGKAGGQRKGIKQRIKSNQERLEAETYVAVMAIQERMETAFTLRTVRIRSYTNASGNTTNRS
jgi:hypothetical protein